MTKKLPVEFEYGPYRAPQVQLGSDLECVLRGRVRVDAFSDGPIRWPCFSRGGRPGFILCGDLVRAIRQEPSVAVQHSWGVRRQTVARWRKVLGVARNFRGR